MGFSTDIEYQVIVHQEDGGLWAEVQELPGVFASGETMDELQEALAEAMSLALSSPDSPMTVKIQSMEQVDDVSVQRLVLC